MWDHERHVAGWNLMTELSDVAKGKTNAGAVALQNTNGGNLPAGMSWQSHVLQ
jgi:hypothetical protein